jgi:DNA-binding CsgD family transcriptional regulator
MLSLVQFARGRAAIAEERFSDAYDEIRRIFDPADIRHHPYVRVWAVADLVDAAVHGDGDVEETQLFLAQLESLAATTGAAFLRSQLSYARPLLAGDDQAESLFKAALAGELERWPCFRGRMLLAYGGWLRRQVRVSESQAQLRAAEETFAALGSVTLCERAQKELRATGETARRRTPGAWAQLTPQELQIAQMAAAGLTNREIGQKLYLSHRTIEYHLHRIFPKLGIAARSQLRDVISEQALV